MKKVQDEEFKFDNVEMTLTQDRMGYTAFKFTVFYKKKPVEVVIFDDCSHRQACRKMDRWLDKRANLDF